MINRIKITIRGAVQGVGFRPFIFNLAKEMRLKGFVGNSSVGAQIEAEGNFELLQNFLLRIEKDKPKIAFISGLEYSVLDPVGYTKFEIIESSGDDRKSAFILPDIAVCSDCLNELFDPNNLRYLYPFINCTNCGPRYSIIESLPYDRKNTSMKEFVMCDNCKDEYEDPSNRRFHAQPIACPICGPQIQLTDSSENVLSTKENALLEVVDLINSGKIIALKGLGGFQLIADPFNHATVQELRERKNRQEKPFALMAPSTEYLQEFCIVNYFEKRLLESPESPVVFLKRKDLISRKLSEMIAPGNPYLGVMLPYTPLHHLLMKRLNRFLIATSGNLSEEPMCFENDQAFKRLSKIADYFLIHNRPIVRPMDDSVVRIVNNKELVLRRARGYTPFPIILNGENKIPDKSVFAVGGHLKNTVALRLEDNVFVSQHIGDLSNLSSFNVFEKTCEDLKNIYSISPEIYIYDLHPEYLSTKYAKAGGKNCTGIQHHLAHVVSCKVENHLEGEVLGVSWDGTGFGLDGNIWGGEFFLFDENTFSHVAQFDIFPLPGGEKAIREPRRSALGVLYSLMKEEAFSINQIQRNFSSNELSILKNALRKNVNCPQTSSTGRLFDAAASLLNICQLNNYEGQAGMMLEFACDSSETSAYNFEIDFQEERYIIKWRNIIYGILDDINSNVEVGKIAQKFHNSLSEVILQVAENVGLNRIVLSGGCFQNMILTECTINLLELHGFKVYTHQRIPPNDGGISLGQAAGYHLKQISFSKKFKEA